MRPVLIGDVMAAACVLLTEEDTGWTACADRLLWQARVADLYRRRLGKPHPAWGNGSLMAAARAAPKVADETFPSDIRYLRALSHVLDRVIASKLSFVSDRSGLYGDVARRTRRQEPWPKQE